MAHRIVRRAALLLGLAGAMAGAVLSAPAAQAATPHQSRPGLLVLDPGQGSLTDKPVADYHATKACPSPNRALAQVALEGSDGTFIDTMTADFTPTAAVPSGSLDTASLSLYALAHGLSSGDYQIAVLCYNDDFSNVVTADTVTIEIDTAAGTWEIDWCATLDGSAGAVPANRGRSAA